MVKTLRAIGFAAEQNIDARPGTKALPALAVEANNGRHELLGRNGAIPGFGRLQTVVAIAAGCRVLTKVGEQHLATTTGGFAQGQHRIQMQRLLAAIKLVAGTLIDHAAQLHHIVQAIGKPGRGRFAISARAAGFLVVALHRLWQINMRNEAHIGFVNPHPERDRGANNQPLFTQKPRLVIGPRFGRQPGVIGERG